MKTQTAKTQTAKTRTDRMVPALVRTVLGAALIYAAAYGAGAAPVPSTGPAAATNTTDVSGTPSPADALLAKAAATLNRVQTLQADFEEDDSYPTPYKDLAQRGTVTLARPGQMRIDINRFRRVTSADAWTPSGNDAVSVSDGTTYTYAFLHPHSTQVREDAATPLALHSALRVLAPLEGFFANADHPTSAHLTSQVSLLPPSVWEGNSYQVVAYSVQTSNQTYEARAYIGADNIVHRLVYRAATAQGGVVKEWTLHNVRLDAGIPASTFSYAAPPDSAPLNRSAGLLPLAAGTPAPDFTLTDAHGQPVRLSDFRGKTVILDFWATWCWPCNQSLPHTNAVVHADRAKNVVALAVAIWDRPAGFTAWLAKHDYPDIHFAIDPRPQGNDVGSSLYHVSATPTAYVIDPNGRVVTSLSGYTGPTGELEAAIKTASSVKAEH